MEEKMAKTLMRPRLGLEVPDILLADVGDQPFLIDPSLGFIE